MKDKKLLVLEVGSENVSEVFMDLYERMPTDQELEKVLENVGDIYSVFDISYLYEDIYSYISSVIRKTVE